ncbi:type III pantothenate kinase [Gemmiger formicilis]|uniref:type III pantothenate kinase n=1 Tax=Gemmiger formicilis TaxID=745368 RepID=UPI00195DC0AB|nr:type III pantothenate kinase [Gemmiger formicilis]MBM6715747.1 type III pantothenate kinase [Gemmiger formicilis]
MLLALNIGNSNITFGAYALDGKLAFSSRLYADTSLSSDELCYKIISMLDLYGAAPADIEAVILASVVPVLTGRLREALQKMTQAPIMEVGPGLKSGVRIRMDNPAQLGAELLCAVVGALRRHKPPLLVMNMDTATTLLAVDKEGSLVGGMILPGPQLSLAALVKNTAQLPQVALENAPKRLLGTNTTDCLHSGMVNGTAATLDAMAAKILAELHAPDAPVIATGTLPASIRDACETPIEYRDTLILEGLFAIWQRNVRH